MLAVLQMSADPPLVFPKARSADEGVSLLRVAGWQEHLQHLVLALATKGFDTPLLHT